MSDISPLEERLLLAQVGACTCATKSHELRYHEHRCHYRLFAEAHAELARLKRGDFTPEEIHGFCHKLPETVDACEFAGGCADYQRTLFGCAPDADDLADARSLGTGRRYHNRRQGLPAPTDRAVRARAAGDRRKP